MYLLPNLFPKKLNQGQGTGIPSQAWVCIRETKLFPDHHPHK
jgi:hypothetical protein